MSPAAALPLIPDGDEARRWAERELDDRAYDIAQPTVIDRAARAVAEFVEGLLGGEVPTNWGGALALILAVVIVAIIVAAFFIWGRPRAQARSTRAALDLFGDTEARTAAELRRDAAGRAASGDWDQAIVLRFRALARGLDERGIVETPPGATVHAFARAAARALPSEAERLEGAAGVFDDVRYLRRPGTRAAYDAVSSADEAAQAAQAARAATREVLA